MKLLDKLKRLVPPSWMPQPKVAASMATAGVTTFVVWAAGKKGYKLPRKNAESVLTGAVALVSAAVAAAGYLKADKPGVVP
jgi:hypothetical protein